MHLPLALGHYEWGELFLQLPADAGSSAEDEEQTALSHSTASCVSAFPFITML